MGYLSGMSTLAAGVIAVISIELVVDVVGSIGAFLMFAMILIMALGLIIYVNWIQVFYLTGCKVSALMSQYQQRKRPMSHQTVDYMSHQTVDDGHAVADRHKVENVDSPIIGQALRSKLGWLWNRSLSPLRAVEVDEPEQAPSRDTSVASTAQSAAVEQSTDLSHPFHSVMADSDVDESVNHTAQFASSVVDYSSDQHEYVPERVDDEPSASGFQTPTDTVVDSSANAALDSILDHQPGGVSVTFERPHNAVSDDHSRMSQSSQPSTSSRSVADDSVITQRITKPFTSTKLPPLSLLNDTIVPVEGYSEDDLIAMGKQLEINLSHFNIAVSVVEIHPGPVVTRFEIEPAPGVKVGQIVQLDRDLARALSVKSVRIVEVIPGKPYIGVEIPNQQREMVNFHELLASKQYQSKKEPLTLALGKDISGKSVVIDLAKTPHLLVAGTTGSGKSVGINSMILSLIYKSFSDQVKLILIDPKMLELSVYEGIPHLLTPVVTDVNNAQAALKWSVAEMERRYKLMSLLGVRNVIGFNDKLKSAREAGSPLKDPLFKPLNSGLDLADEAPELELLPYIVVVIDEFADLMMTVGKQVEELIARLAQKARAAGIHLILATQRPSVNVITGLIKANVPSRLSFQVSTKIDSRTILDQGGAEQLLGLGDMLYLEPGKGLPLRAHGAFVSDEEVHQTVEWLKQHYDEPEYIDDLTSDAAQTVSDLGVSVGIADLDDDSDELFKQAYESIQKTGKVSISRVQRELRIGFNRAARLVEEMQEKGLVSEPDERGVRRLLVVDQEESLD